ncbi:HAMP domain-containing sensor histidine kinase [Marispirochaeta sp.]|jgi:two-component system, NtrC family, sensor histidine kinase HydH|uniref:sensor histidine kinase n=1 Tax=Marispirochaeta sp. TaxID=2038653 RepID=UPI0029C6C012|nr:HAMP domain-containing sensor histidine kinase [Marispirochaeta sp.]
MKQNLTTWSLGFLVFVGLSLVNVVIFNGLKENNSLTSRNAGERAINDFIVLLRQYDSPEETIKVYENRTGTRILGIGGYSSQGELLFVLGTPPDSLSSLMIPEEDEDPRVYIPNRENRSLVVIQHRPPRPERRFTPEPPQAKTLTDKGSPTISPAEEKFRHMFSYDLYYWEIHQPHFWNRRLLYRILFPASEAAIAGLILYMVSLTRKNSEFRRRIEEQKNLVIIGTAASTLAHEIKNPLSIIRLQTGIIERTAGKDVSRELAIINEETTRLAMLAHYVNDYLRDPVGNPERLSPTDILKVHSCRVFGREIHVSESSPDILIRFDPARFQSVAGNLLLNALESGSDPDKVSVIIDRKGSRVSIEIADRGKGIPTEDMERIFDPFFTTKGSGTGVGLAVVKRFVEAVEGRLFLRNRAGGGITVVIELPEFIIENTDC